MKTSLKEAKIKLVESLHAKTPDLINEISRMMIDKPFVLDRGVSKAAVNAIHFIYSWPSFITVACPMNVSTGYFGGNARLELSSKNSGLFLSKIDREVLAAATESERESIEESLGSLKTSVYFSWFLAAWKLAREADQSMRGFLSIHDTIWHTDLDTGKKFREGTGSVKFF